MTVRAAATGRATTPVRTAAAGRTAPPVRERPAGRAAGTCAGALVALAAAACALALSAPALAHESVAPAATPTGRGGPAAAPGRRAGGAAAFRYVECQHPVMTGVEVYRLHRISSRRACPLALALYRWEVTGNHERDLFGCRGRGRHTPFLKLHRFDGWRISLRPAFTLSRRGASFAVGGTDFPINCS